MDVIIVFKLGDNRGEQKRRDKNSKGIKKIYVFFLWLGFFYIELYSKKKGGKK